MNWRVARDARNSAAVRQVAVKPESLGVNRTRELVATLDPTKIEWVRHLGDRIVGSDADGHRFVLC